jgi:hypothetical protein
LFRLLRLGGNAKRKEHSAKRKTIDFYSHELFLAFFLAAKGHVLSFVTKGRNLS